MKESKGCVLMKKHKKVFIIILIFVFVVVGMNAVILLTNALKPTEKSSFQKKSADVESIVCTYVDDEDYHYTIELAFQENRLITKTDTMTWENKTKEICTFYTKRGEVYNSISGIVDTVSCNDENGTRKTVYTFSTLDTKEARIAESRYVLSDQTFDFDGYKTYRVQEGYTCHQK